MSLLYNDFISVVKKKSSADRARCALVDSTISFYRTRIASDSDSHDKRSEREAIGACSRLGSEEGSVLPVETCCDYEISSFYLDPI